MSTLILFGYTDTDDNFNVVDTLASEKNMTANEVYEVVKDKFDEIDCSEVRYTANVESGTGLDAIIERSELVVRNKDVSEI